MQLRRIRRDGTIVAQARTGDGWRNLPATDKDLVALLAKPDELAKVNKANKSNIDDSDAEIIAPFEPRSLRDFMLYERHVIDATRGYVRRFKPALLPIITGYEKLFGEPFPMLKPKPLWYKQPIYYMGNHLNVFSDGNEIEWPAYSDTIDYELEIAGIIARPLHNATEAEAANALAAFVILNDFSARDVQKAEMDTGMGLQKSKHFANAISSIAVTADDIMPHFESLTGSVWINGAQVTEVSAAGAHYTLAQAIAHASKGEQLHPGEMFASGTLPGGSGLENGHLLERGDTIELRVDRLGALKNRIV